jgi:hypothetical protein
MANLKRKTEFKKEAKFKPAQINDTRFGVRRIYLNQKEKPSTFSYANPGRGWHGYN